MPRGLAVTFMSRRARARPATATDATDRFSRASAWRPGRTSSLTDTDSTLLPTATASALPFRHP
jgi:hypothetical protein